MVDADIYKAEKRLLYSGNQKPSVDARESEFSVQLEVAHGAPLGLTLSQTHHGLALVQRLAQGGVAEAAGIQPADYIVGLDTDREWRYPHVLLGIKQIAPAKGASPAKRTLHVMRPQWKPDTFLMNVVQQGSSSQELEEITLSKFLAEEPQESVHTEIYYRSYIYGAHLLFSAGSTSDPFRSRRE